MAHILLDRSYALIEVLVFCAMALCIGLVFGQHSPKKRNVTFVGTEYFGEDEDIDLRIRIDGEEVVYRGSGTSWNRFPSGDSADASLSAWLYDRWVAAEWARPDDDEPDDHSSGQESESASK